MAERDLKDPWLVAVWPGMGSVAWIAGGYLLEQLAARRVGELKADGYFELQAVEVRNGLAAPARMPHNLFFEWRDPRRRHDLLIFVGEAQPTTHGYELAQKVLEYAIRRGVQRFFTFAAMATQLQPGNKPRVFAAANDARALGDVKDRDVELLEGGQISGLNGLLLAAGAERGLSGLCLLGELPYFAVGVPNPRAARAALEIFGELAGVELNFGELDRQAEVIDEQLDQLLEQMQQSAESEDEEQGPSAEPSPAAPAAPAQSPPPPDPRVQRRIELLFEKAMADRSKAMDLKRELDRLGIFKQYEDRFLDLFRKGE